VSELVFETVLDAPPEKVWRALTIPEYRDRWLQPPDGAIVEPVEENVQNLFTLRIQEGREESLATFEISPNDTGGTNFRLTHVPVIPAAANSNEPLMLAA
jgi:uncharacterized protein YndB with AHSA1/START domain